MCHKQLIFLEVIAFPQWFLSPSSLPYGTILFVREITAWDINSMTPLNHKGLRTIIFSKCDSSFSKITFACPGSICNNFTWWHDQLLRDERIPWRKFCLWKRQIGIIRHTFSDRSNICDSARIIMVNRSGLVCNVFKFLYDEHIHPVVMLQR